MSHKPPLEGVHFSRWADGFLWHGTSHVSTARTMLTEDGKIAWYVDVYSQKRGYSRRLGQGSSDSVTEARRGLIADVIRLGATVADEVHP